MFRVRARVCACVRACVCVWVGGGVRVRVCVCVRVCVGGCLGRCGCVQCNVCVLPSIRHLPVSYSSSFFSFFGLVPPTRA